MVTLYWNQTIEKCLWHLNQSCMYPCAILSTLTTRPQQVDKKIVYAGALRIKHQHHHHHHHRITKFVMTSGGSGSRGAYLKESPGNQDQIKKKRKKTVLLIPYKTPSKSERERRNNYHVIKIDTMYVFGHVSDLYITIHVSLFLWQLVSSS